jgi:hypothetical protein
MSEDRLYTPGELGLIFQSISDKLDIVQLQNAKDHEEIKSTLNAHEPRIRSLELWRSLIIGSISILTFLTTVFGIWIIEKMIS